MNLSEAIRGWLLDNPGWHFMADIREGLGASYTVAKVINTVDQMARRGQIQSAGRHGSKRYTFGRNAQQTIQQESCNV